MPVEFRWVDPRELRLPASMPNGADPGTLARQIGRFGASSAGMPPLIVYEGLILDRLAAVLPLADDARFGQLVAFLPMFSTGDTPPRLADMEDEELLQALDQHYRDLLAREAKIASSASK